MKKIILSAIAFFVIAFSTAQTFTGTGGGIPDGGPMVSFPITVSGLSPTSIDTIFGLETVCVDITHPWNADLNISLESPDGTIFDLSIGNGGDSDDYQNTCFNGFSTNSIVTGWGPFAGTYRPQGFMGIVNNGQTGNGTWTLHVQDTYGADAGTLNNWNITFGNTPAKPFNFVSSNLPIVVINTFNQAIPNEPKLAAQMGIIFNGTGVRNYLTDPFNNYNNKIGIELRGSSSMGFPQKSYGFETRDINGIKKDTVVLGMPEEHDWILTAPYNDKTCMRNVLSYDIANKTGHYASRTEFCEVMLNGQYQGIYVLMEKIKRDTNRVDVSKLLPTEITGDDLTGGYIIKVDRDDGPGSYWTSPYPSAAGTPINFVHVYPKNGDLAPQQRAYIQSYVDTLENVLNGPGFMDPLTGYRKYLGVNSFIDYFILNEISKNVDGYRLSSFFFKDKQSDGGKLKAGPAWDFNLGWWNANYCEGELSTGWAYQFHTVCPGDGWQLPFWWDRLLQDPSYTAQLRCRWNELRLTSLSLPALNNYIDSTANYLNEAQGRHFTAWPLLGVYTWPNPSPLPADYAGEITAMKDWIQNRVTWMDANLPGICNVNVNELTLTENNVTVYPNPFNSGINVNFYLPSNSELGLEITDMLGRSIKQLEPKEYLQGNNIIPVSLPESAPAGIYLLKLSSSAGTVLKKITKMD
ncbi:MAG: CotH kinase family protein [Bacteroidota bacterium]|nr:CotH kinase family protein [Bacteroidota bacterium]